MRKKEGAFAYGTRKRCLDILLSCTLPYKLEGHCHLLQCRLITNPHHVLGCCTLLFPREHACLPEALLFFAGGQTFL